MVAARMQTEVVPRAARALKRALRVKVPVSGNLRLPRTCGAVFAGEDVCKEVGPFCGRGVPIQPLPDTVFADYQCDPMLP
jgi:hypothetical protein